MMDELRLSLIAIGIVFIGAIYLLGRMVERSRAVRRMPSHIAAQTQPHTTTEPSLAEEDFAVDFDTVEIADERYVFDQADPEVKPVTEQLKPKAPIGVPLDATPAPRVHTTPQHAVPSREPDLIISLTLMARDDQKFRGDELHTALQAAGLELGDFDIYHYCDTDLTDDTRAIFSVANIVKPGTFSAATRRDFSTIGLALFMQLPGPMTASEALDALLEKAHFIAQRLRGVVGDDHRTPLSPQRIRELRERTLNYDFMRAQRVEQPHMPGGRAH